MEMPWSADMTTEKLSAEIQRRRRVANTIDRTVSPKSRAVIHVENIESAIAEICHCHPEMKDATNSLWIEAQLTYLALNSWYEVDTATRIGVKAVLARARECGLVLEALEMVAVGTAENLRKGGAKP